MNKILIIWFLIIVTTSVSAESTDTNRKQNPISKYSFMDLIKKPINHNMCYKDTRLASCSGIKDVKACGAVVSKVSTMCEKRVLDMMPTFLDSEEKLGTYSKEFVMCVGINISKEGGKNFKEIDSCMRKGFKAF